jgi:LCP family protein required for cell wall assembly
VILVLGVALGTSLFFLDRVNDFFGMVATEEFDPAGAAARLAGRSPTQLQESVRELNQDQRDAIDAAASSDLNTFEIESQIEDLITEIVGGRKFNIPAAFSPPLPDDMFDAYLGLGADATGALADVIILALAPSDGSAPILVSLPRDLYLQNPCTERWNRLNTGLGGCRGYASGIELIALMVENYTGIRIDHVAKVNFEGFAQVVDALGGTSICTDYPTMDEKSHLELPGGCIEADGATTLAWVRSRHTQQLIDGEWRQVAGSDFARQRRQQQILFQLADQVASFSSLTSFDNRIRAVAGAVRLDQGWSFPNVVRTAWRYRGISRDQVKSFSVEVKNYRTSSGAAVLIPTVPFNSSLAEVYSPAAR